ncbi:hypothetical protein ACIP6V_20775 [Streptomyces sp. NPDC088770]|uniref:hypothetical protein n=1 Tax=unclassified Streptomyces TaxID=2593676 RepID=UPI00382F1E28
MKSLIVLGAPFVVFVMPTLLVWLLGRRAGVPAWTRALFLSVGWLTVIMGWILSQRAQPFLFPEESPCHGTGAAVSQYFPPDSFCLHSDGELRSVNGPAAQLLFWTAAGTTGAAVVVAARTRRRT